MKVLLDFLNSQMDTPVMYHSFSESWFQYVSLTIFIILIIIIGNHYKECNDLKIRKFIRTMAIILIIFELLKQVNFSYVNNWHYQWYAFPFQFCSTPMYIAFIASYLKKSKIRDAMYMFLATFGLFSGVAVMLYPATVYTSTVFINIQTMVHHGGIAILGLVLLANYVSLDKKSFFRGAMVFISLTIFAYFLNTAHDLWINEGSFNMFFINPHYQSQIPVLSIFQPLVPSFVYITIFVIGFSFIAYIIFSFRKFILKQKPQTTKKSRLIYNNAE